MSTNKMALKELQISAELDNWDVVRCAICGRYLSMLNADTIKHNVFIHKNAECAEKENA